MTLHSRIIGSEAFVFDGEFHWDGNKPPSVQQCLKEWYSQINNYDKWLIYHFQDPGNFDEPYFNHEVFVEKVNMTIEADEDPDETEFELEEESEISSDSF